MSPATEPNYFSTQVSASRRFYLELKSVACRQITVLSGGWERCRTDYEINRSEFSSPTVEFVSRGAGTLTLGGRPHELKPGTVFVYGEGTPHRIRSSRDSAMKKYFVAFDGGRKMLEECQVFPGSVFQVMQPERIEQIFDDLIDHGLSDSANRARMCRVALQYLLMKIADSAAPSGMAGSAAAATYQRCRQFIETHYLRIHTLHEVAAGCNVDRAYLCRLFKRFRRQPPYQYLQNLKMNRAAELLQKGDYSIKQAAEQLGFADPYIFSRTFKRIFGISPQQMLKRAG